MITIGFYRIYHYPLKSKSLRHIYFNRSRTCKLIKSDDIPNSNVSNILSVLGERERLSQSLSRSRRFIRDIILCNKFDFFCTFTFNADRVDRFNFNDCKKKILSFFKDYKKRYSPDFKYLIVPEFHKNGAVHFHGMISGIRSIDFIVPEFISYRDSIGRLKQKKNVNGYVRWKNYTLGFFDCSLVRKYNACAVYVSKYVTKDLVSLYSNQRCFFASLDLVRPELVFDCDDVPLIFKPDFENEFISLADSSDDFGVLPDYSNNKFADVYELDEGDVFEYEPFTMGELQLRFPSYV